MRKLIIVCATFFMIVGSAGAQNADLKPIFNGKNLKGWTTFLRTKGVNHDPEQVFRVKNKELHVSGKEFGYVATTKTYDNFHLSLEFRWGEKKHPPREKDKRDAGICFHVEPEDKIWPRSVECQIQEGDTGDLWLIGKTTAVVDGKQTQPQDYARVVKRSDAELPHGEWNRVEVISDGGSFKFLVNGKLVNEGSGLSVGDGRILLQSEGAEIFYRNIKIAEL